MCVIKGAHVGGNALNKRRNGPKVYIVASFEDRDEATFGKLVGCQL